MGDLSRLTRGDRPALAYRRRNGRGPAILFLPGYASDMTGTKAKALDAWAAEAGRAFLRFDYAGCGASDGAFEDQILADWLADTLAMIDLLDGPVILVGSSLGGWLMLLAALERPAQVAALIGVAPAPDFSDWGFDLAAKMTINREGRLERPSAYGGTTVTTRAFWTSAEAHRVLHRLGGIACPVRILQGQQDPDVPWTRAVDLADKLGPRDVQLTLIKDGDHRLSRAQDIALLTRLIEELP